MSLTPRQRQVLDMLADGATDAEIARTLVLHPVTVRRCIAAAVEKMGARTRTSAVAQYVRERDGLVAH